MKKASEHDAEVSFESPTTVNSGKHRSTAVYFDINEGSEDIRLDTRASDARKRNFAVSSSGEARSAAECWFKGPFRFALCILLAKVAQDTRVKVVPL